MNDTTPDIAPDIASTEAERTPSLQLVLHPNAVDLWFWTIVIWATLGALPGVIITLIAGVWKLSIAIVLVAILVARRLMAYSRRYAQSFACELSADGLLIKRGVWWRSETYVPRARVQHTDVNQGPIARRYGIAKLKVFTAGTQESEIEVGGLARADALRLRDEMLGRHGHDAV
jgi:hypothetical protein